MVVRLALTVVAAAGISSAALADPLSELLDKSGGEACFTRIYDRAHLDKNPAQKTTELRLSLVPDERDGAIIRVLLRLGTRANYIAGTCDWAARANLDINGKPIIGAFKGPSGLNCWALTSEDGSSAEEGGNFFIDLKDGASIYLYLPEYLAAWPSYDRSDYAEFLQLGTEDRVFRLDKVTASPCKEMIEGLPWLL